MRTFSCVCDCVETFIAWKRQILYSESANMKGSGEIVFADLFLTVGWKDNDKNFVHNFI